MLDIYVTSLDPNSNHVMKGLKFRGEAKLPPLAKLGFKLRFVFQVHRLPTVPWHRVCWIPVFMSTLLGMGHPLLHKEAFLDFKWFLLFLKRLSFYCMRILGKRVLNWVGIYMAQYIYVAKNLVANARDSRETLSWEDLLE